MNELQFFTNKDFGGIRALEIDGQPWFVGKDVADIPIQEMHCQGM